MKSNDVIAKLYNKKANEKLEKKIKLLGKNNKLEVNNFIKLRLLSSVIVFLLVLYLFDFGYVLAPIITFLYYYVLGKILIDNKVNARSKKLELEAQHFFEVLTLSLETGRNLEEAIRVTTYSIDSDLSEEFKEALRELNYGKTLVEALTSMQNRIPSQTINNIILILTEANIFGSSIIDTMYNQVDYLREKRRLEIKGEISKIPIKISVISVLFFVPLMLLIILGPAILTYLGM